MNFWAAAILAVATAGSALGQTMVTPDGQIAIRTGNSVEVVSVLDTGVKREFPGQPYSAKVTTTTTSYLARRGGIPAPRVQTEWDYRDSEGRERFDRGATIRMADPVGGFGAVLQTGTRVARVTHYTRASYNAANAKRTQELQAEAAAKRAERADKPLLETLPEQTMAGVRVEGVRETYTIPAGREGNADEVKIVVEIWTSPELKIVMASSRDDPRSSKETMIVSDLVRGEPDPKLFQIPPDYEAVDTATGEVTLPH